MRRLDHAPADEIELSESTQRTLAGRGLTRVLSEGDPASARAAVCRGVTRRTLSRYLALVVGEQPTRITAGPALHMPATLHLAHVLEEDDYLFMQYHSR